MKLVWIVAVDLAVNTMEYEAQSNEAKYIGALFFGYTSFRVWGDDKPAKEVAWFWFFIQPFLFGTVGA